MCSLGVERIVWIPDDLDWFKDRPMYMRYAINDDLNNLAAEGDGVFRLVERLVMIYVRVWLAVRGWRGCPTFIPMIHMQQWGLGNFMQNWSCMHPCGHSNIKFLWSCDTRAQDSFFLFNSTQCFQNMFFYQSESILGIRKIFTAFTLQVYTHYFKNWLRSVKSFKEKLEIISFHKHVVLHKIS